MSYRRDKKDHPVINALFSAAIVGLIVAIVYGTSFVSWFSNVTHRIFDGGLQDKVSLQENAEHTNAIIRMSRAKMADYIHDLETTNSMLRARVLDTQRLESENDQLRAMVNAIDRDASLVVSGRVVKRPLSSIYDTLVINVGKQQGVSIGQSLVYAGSVYLGEVVEVSATTAMVRMATTQGVEREIRSVRTGDVLTAEGHNSSHVVIKVPREVDIEEGDQYIDVVSNKLSLAVYAITFDDREPFKTVYARSPVNVRQLDWVQVLR